MKIARTTALLATSILMSAPLIAHAGKVIAIADGDTLTAMVNNKPMKVRLANVDAPEKGQPFDAAARKSLTELCLNKPVDIKEQDMDNQGRTLALVSCSGVDVNRAQVERGMAWVVPKSNNDMTLPAIESTARRERRGLWADAEPVAPWDFRRPIKKASTVARRTSVEGICFIDRFGEYAIVDGKKRYGC